MGPQTWEAIFTVMIDIIGTEIDSSKFADVRWIGCGEFRPIEEPQTDNRRSEKNRRVEFLIYPEDKFPRISPPYASRAAMDAAYNDVEYKFTEISYDNTPIDTSIVRIISGTLNFTRIRDYNTGNDLPVADQKPFPIRLIKFKFFIPEIHNREIEPLSEGETDEDGNMEWLSEFENEGSQVTRSINPTNDGGYIVGGMTSTEFGDPECDAILYKINPFDNGQPTKPTITGSHKGKPDKDYTFTASSSDPDDQQIFYMWDWGDGNYSEWLNTPKATYTWVAEDNFQIRVLVKDFYGYESEWSDPFAFSTPKDKATNTPLFLQNLFKHFPFMVKILNQIL